MRNATLHHKVLWAASLAVLVFGGLCAGHRYALDVAVDYDAGTFAGTLDIGFVNPAPRDLDEVWFRVYANAPGLFGSAHVDVLSAEVHGVAAPLAAFVDDTAWVVSLPAPLAPGQSASLRLAFEGRASRLDRSDPGDAGYGLLTKSDHALTLTTFYPVIAPYLDEGWALDPVMPFGDALFAEAADYLVTLRLPEGVRAIPPLEGQPPRTYAATSARDVAFVLVDDDRVAVSASWRAGAALAWFEPPHAEAATLAAQHAAAALDVFSSHLGPPPQETLHVVEVPLAGVAGMELHGMVLVSSAYGARPRDPFFEVIVSHETAHQWFYAAVGNDPVEAPWLDEAFATYLSNVYFAEIVSEARAEAERQDWALRYASARATYPLLGPGSPLYAFPDGTTYSAFVYSGGALALAKMRAEMGDEAFFVALRSYVCALTGRIATPEDLAAALAAQGGLLDDGLSPCP
ncbi:MAG: M1 family aminopeptidase [Candidatus Bipolaricaulota bacterium]